MSFNPDIQRLLQLQRLWYILIIILIILMLFLETAIYLDCEKQLEHERMIWKNLREMVNEVQRAKPIQ